MEYLDFDLKVTAGTEQDYVVAITHSPAGEVDESSMRLPFDEATLNRRLKALETDILRSSFQGRLAPTQQEETAQDFGEVLFKTLISGEVRTRYDISLQMARQQRKGLRVRLHVQPAELAPLPWEFMYDTRQGEYVCLSRNTPIIRYLDLEQTVQPLEIAPPLQILGLIASPSDMPPLDVKREKQRLEDALKDLVAHGSIQLTWMEGKTWRDLQKAMRTGQWHIFHFIGHGGFDKVSDEGLIIVEDENGEADRLHATELSRLLADNGYLRLVLLNSCEGAQGSKKDVFSSTASVLMHKGIPAVLAMQYEISDRAAIEFSSSFYQTLAEGLPVDEAVAEARKSVSLAINDTLEWATPVLHMRSPDGMLFNIHPGAAPAQAPVPAARSQPVQTAPAAVEIPLAPASVTAGAAVTAGVSRGSAIPQPAGSGGMGGEAPPASGAVQPARPFPWRIAFAVLAVLVVVAILIAVLSSPKPPPAVAVVPEPTPSSAPTQTEALVVISTTVAPTASLTPAPSITDTPEPSLTPSLAVTATPTVFPFTEDFLNNNNGWLVQTPNGSTSSAQVNSNIADGKLTYDVTCPIHYGAAECPIYFKIPIQSSVKDFQLSFDSTITRASDTRELKVSVQFRGERSDPFRDNYYAVYFRRDGYYAAQVRVQGATTSIFTYLVSGGRINRDVGFKNHFMVGAKGTQFQVWANNSLLRTFDDTKLSEPGDMFFVLYVTRGMSASFNIENVVIKEAP